MSGTKPTPDGGQFDLRESSTKAVSLLGSAPRTESASGTSAWLTELAPPSHGFSIVKLASVCLGGCVQSLEQLNGGGTWRSCQHEDDSLLEGQRSERGARD